MDVLAYFCGDHGVVVAYFSTDIDGAEPPDPLPRVPVAAAHRRRARRFLNLPHSTDRGGPTRSRVHASVRDPTGSAQPSCRGCAATGSVAFTESKR
jgi:hypothetical protein